MNVKPYLFLLTVAVLTACNHEASVPAPQAAAPSVTDTAEQAPPGTPPAEPIDDAHGLAGTSWQLVEIASMDDSVFIPDEPERYTLSFGANGTVAIQADCNRGSGTWAGGTSSELTFGPIAATMAMCAPESLSDRYLKQFEWVRSYVLRDEHLFLATMADGSIIEFSPLP